MTDSLTKPSVFYRQRRPWNFSDSEEITESKLSKEVLNLEIETITINQKENEFEVLCRKLCEKLICPNLIPQTGPTWWWDWKTDSETHMVSKFISDIWFIPENWRTRNEKRAFAFSAKKDRATKVRSDIKNIISTKREYTRVYFITNQAPSSKRKKTIQDELRKEYSIEVEILDRKRILEKIYDNKLLNIVIDSLNLSPEFKIEKKLWPNDLRKSKELEAIEKNISNPNRYYEGDYLIVEDCIEAAILSRTLELPKADIIWKFDRAKRICEKTNIKRQWIKILYQSAWTYFMYFDDIKSFLEEYKKLRTYIDNTCDIDDIQFLNNLLTLIKSINNLSEYNLDLIEEEKFVYDILSKKSKEINKPCTSLRAKTMLSIQKIHSNLKVWEDAELTKNLQVLKEIFILSERLLDYPFLSYKETVCVFWDIIHKNTAYDELFEKVIEISQKRESSKTIGNMYINRWFQMIENNQFNESIICFWKSITKLAKEESKMSMYMALKWLWHAYAEIWLMLASNNCLVFALDLYIKERYETWAGATVIISTLKELIGNELIIGRIPYLLSWLELYLIVSNKNDAETKEERSNFLIMVDGCLSTRFLNTDFKYITKFNKVPDLLSRYWLEFSKDSLLYLLWHTQELEEYKSIDPTIDKIDDFFDMLYHQPFTKQIIYETNFLENKEILIKSNILWCEITVNTINNKELMLVWENILAYFEWILSTWLQNVFPYYDKITLNLTEDGWDSLLYTNQANIYEIKVNLNKIKKNKDIHILSEKIWKLCLYVLANSFHIKDIDSYLNRLFKEENIVERTWFLTNYLINIKNIFWEDPKLCLEDWENSENNYYELKRTEDLVFTRQDKDKEPDEDHSLDLNKHNKRKCVSIINNGLRDNAIRSWFGFFLDQSGLLWIFLGFKEVDYGKKIFEERINKIGKIDSEDLIRISIVKWIDKDNIFHYRVAVTANIKPGDKDGILIFITRNCTMAPKDSKNLDNLIEIFNSKKTYMLYPAQFDQSNPQSNPKILFEMWIKKTELNVMNAREIDEKSLDSWALAGIKNPINPRNKKD